MIIFTKFYIITFFKGGGEEHKGLYNKHTGPHSFICTISIWLAVLHFDWLVQTNINISWKEY